MGSHDTSQVCRTAGGADEDAHGLRRGLLLNERSQGLGGAVGREHPGQAGDLELGQNGQAGLQSLQVRVGPHEQCNFHDVTSTGEEPVIN